MLRQLNDHDREVMKFFDLVPSEWDCVIAGGAAVGLGVHEDVDLWLLNRPNGLSAVEIGKLKLHLHRLDQGNEITLDPFVYAIIENQVEHAMSSSGDEDVIQMANDEDFTIPAKGEYRGKKFQIMTTPLPNERELLRRFDLSVHQIAIHRNGAISMAHSTTAPGEPIKITRFTTPLSTFRRLIKLCARYDVSIEMGKLSGHNDLARLLETGIMQQRKSSKPKAPEPAHNQELGLVLDDEVPF